MTPAPDPRACEWCTFVFTPRRHHVAQRFCGRSCAAKWRASKHLNIGRTRKVPAVSP